MSWNQINKFSKNYLPLKHSYNRQGGIQFSYSFWMNMKNATNNNIAWKDIILKGEPQTIKYNVTRFRHDTYKHPHKYVVDNVGVKCPRIRFGSTYDSLQVELNTIDNPDETFIFRSITAPGKMSSLRNNAIKLAQDKWALITFTFEDHVAINNHEDGIIVKFFFNDVLYNSKSIHSAMRPNKSNLHLFPSINNTGTPIMGSRIGNIIYFNYAINQDDIRKIYSRGPPRHMMDPHKTDTIGQPLYLSEYNKADVYNT